MGNIGSKTLITERTDKSFTSHTSVCLTFFRSAVIFGLYQRTDLPGGDGVALLAADRILMFGTKKLRPNWDLPLAQVLRVINEDHGIRFAHKAGKDRDKYVVIEDQKSQAWFYEQIAGVVKSFNARRRMDS